MKDKTNQEVVSGKFHVCWKETEMLPKVKPRVSLEEAQAILEADMEKLMTKYGYTTQEAWSYLNALVQMGYGYQSALEWITHTGHGVLERCGTAITEEEKKDATTLSREEAEAILNRDVERIVEKHGCEKVNALACLNINARRFGYGCALEWVMDHCCTTIGGLIPKHGIK